jgi:hypothetical protein
MLPLAPQPSICCLVAWIGLGGKRVSGERECVCERKREEDGGEHAERLVKDVWILYEIGGKPPHHPGET